MMRWMTAGESHGEALVGVIEGLPAGVRVSSGEIAAALARRRLGYGRGARMGFERDEVRLIAGLRHGETLGSPIAIEIGNTEWPKWTEVMSPDPLDSGVDPATDFGARGAPLTRPRPGHADLVGLQKYDRRDARDILERASARETAARVALGCVAAAYLRQVAGIEIVSHVVALGGVETPVTAGVPSPDDGARIDADLVRCADPATSAAMVARIDEAHKTGDTLGGVVEVLAFGVPVGLGSHIQWDRRLDARLAGALMSIQAIKGVEVGDGFATATRPGSQAHDEIDVTAPGAWLRRTNRAGGVEGGMSNGEPIRVRAAMKPIATVPRALATVDLATGAPARAHHQRSDVCAVPAAGVVAEAMVSLVLAEALVDKCGGDSLGETRRNLESYLASWPEPAGPVERVE